MVKFGVWVVDLILQYTVDILNAAGHGRGGVVWLALALGLGLVGLIWPFCGVLCRVFGHLWVFLASTGAARGVLVAKVVPEGMPATVGGGAGSVHTLCSLRLPACAAGHNHPPQRPYSPHSLPRPAYGDLGPLAYGREEAESKKLNALNFCLIPGDSASI